MAKYEIQNGMPVLIHKTATAQSAPTVKSKPRAKAVVRQPKPTEVQTHAG